jgi:NADH-quinone oxidoreductase subunit N
MMLMIMFSMAGVPPFIGFYAKLLVLGSLVDVGLTWMAAVAVLLAVIGAFYYLRLVWYMYFTEPQDHAPVSAAGDMRFVISLNGLGLLALGLFPGFLLDICLRVMA